MMAAALVAAALCQWFVAGLAPQSGAVGMGVPVPLSWEAAVAGSATGNGGSWRSDAGSERNDWQATRRRLSRGSSPLPLTASFELRNLFLLWGRLQLEGG